MKNHFRAWFFVLLSCAGCVAQMTPQYDTYTTYDLDPSTSTVSQAVVVEGVTLGSCGNIPGCWSATHTLKVANKLNVSAFNGAPTSPDWTVGPTVSPFNYMSFSSTVTAIVPPGEEVTSWTGAQVFCSFIGGPIVYALINSSIGESVSNFKYASIAGNVCTYNLSCPNGNQSASCPASTAEMATPCPYEYHIDYGIYTRSGSTKKCFFMSLSRDSNTPANCK